METTICLGKMKNLRNGLLAEDVWVLSIGANMNSGTSVFRAWTLKPNLLLGLIEIMTERGDTGLLNSIYVPVFIYSTMSVLGSDWFAFLVAVSAPAIAWIILVDSESIAILWLPVCFWEKTTTITETGTADTQASTCDPPRAMLHRGRDLSGGSGRTSSSHEWIPLYLLNTGAGSCVENEYWQV